MSGVKITNLFGTNHTRFEKVCLHELLILSLAIAGQKCQPSMNMWWEMTVVTRAQKAVATIWAAGEHLIDDPVNNVGHKSHIWLLLLGSPVKALLLLHYPKCREVHRCYWHSSRLSRCDSERCFVLSSKSLRVDQQLCQKWMRKRRLSC